LLLYLFCFGHCLCLLSLEPCHLNYKNHVPLSNTEQGAAGLIWRFMKSIRVARLYAPGAHFLKYGPVRLSRTGVFSSRVSSRSFSRVWNISFGRIPSCSSHRGLLKFSSSCIVSSLFSRMTSFY